MSSFGILMPAVRPPRTVAVGDDRTLQVRARRAKDIDILRARYMQKTLGPTLYTPTFDYEYRAYCTPESFALAMAAMVMEIDYLKFKPTTESKFADQELHRCYNAIWSSVLANLSTEAHRADYWHRARPGKGAPKHGQAGSGSGSPWYPAGGHTHLSANPDEANYTYPGTARAGIDNVFEAVDYAMSPWAGAHRSTAADRDVYEPDPALDELSASNSSIDALYARIDAVLDERATNVDHLACDHTMSANARSRCLRRRRRAESDRIAALRRAIDAKTDTSAGHIAAGAAETEVAG